MNVEELLTAVNDGGRKWTLFRHSKPSKKKMIASLIAWSQSLSQQLGESNDRERELQHENGDLKSQQAQFEERLDAMTKQVTHHKAKETQLERKLDKIENNAKAIEDEITALRTKKHELEMTKQHLESDTARLKGEIKGKEDIINHTKDALEKCRHDCTNKETKYLTVESEKSRLEDKLQASAEEKRYLQSEIDRLHEMLNTEERKQRKLKKDLSATRQVLNESFKDKNNIEKQLSAEIEGFRYQVFTLSKALHEKKVQVETLKKEKGMLMFYYQDKLCELNQNKSTSEPETNTPAICSPALDKSVQESYLQSTANILKNKVLDLESHVYRHEKLTEALVDIIQSHDPDFELEEEGILQSYVDQKKGSSSEGPPLHLNDLYLEPGCSNDLDLYTAVPGRYHNEGGDLVSSISTDTCATADSPQSGLSSAGSLDADTYETSTSFSDTDTCSLYSDFPTNGSS